MQYDIAGEKKEPQRLREEQDKLESFGDTTQRKFKGLSEGLQKGIRWIKSASYPAGEQQVRKVIFWVRKERRIHKIDEIRQLLKQKGGKSLTGKDNRIQGI